MMRRENNGLTKVLTFITYRSTFSFMHHLNNLFLSNMLAFVDFISQFGGKILNL